MCAIAASTALAFRCCTHVHTHTKTQMHRHTHMYRNVETVVHHRQPACLLIPTHSFNLCPVIFSSKVSVCKTEVDGVFRHISGYFGTSQCGMDSSTEPAGQTCSGKCMVARAEDGAHHLSPHLPRAPLGIAASSV